ncbi:MAG: undecaprenyl/decaprenyl-phosphate alpha-N-acetylglucosaminyl 1-phosphate transferase, partial [Verrucomicrobiae bacterium]|nr:undecaprenyl/decaprenyl-phosphate alpha-N-acetylglucosaminyl 1-phosphate transferase [Verrucomicrobiae bacterium]
IPLLAAFVVLFFEFPEAQISERFQYGFGKRFDQLTAICGGAVGILVLGWLDDKHELKPMVKFGGQLLVAFATALSGVRITMFVESLFFSYVITVFWILTIVNAMNFLDNMNGLCAGLTVIGAGSFGLIAAYHEQYLVGSFCWLVAGAFLGFIPYNYPKATVFLGDAGSHLAGYLLAVLGILPHFYSKAHPDEWAVLTPVVILGLPLVDITQVVIRRIRAGNPIYVGDNNHISHLLARKGVSKTATTAILWGIGLLLGVVGFLINV